MYVYDVVITGFLPGSDPAEARLRLAQLFKATSVQIDRICASFPYTVKSAVDAETGARYRAALERAGVTSVVLDKNLSADLPPIADSGAEDSVAESGTDAPRAERSLVRRVINGIGILMVFGGIAASGYEYVSKRLGSKSSPAAVSASNPAPARSHDEKLRKYAIEDLHQSKFSLAKPDGLCDRVTDEEFDFTFGAASINVDGSGNTRTLPAAVVRHRFTCVMNALAQKNKEEQWNILALDEEFGTLRCIRTGPAVIVASNYVSCAFQPSDGVAPEFPPPHEVDESFRGKYAELLTKIQGQRNALPSPASAQIGSAESARTLVAGVKGSPSFVLDEPYDSVRSKMLGQGWSPFTSAQADDCSPHNERCEGRPEMESCAGSGMAPCRFLWTKDGTIIAVLTIGEDPVIRSVESAGELPTTSQPLVGSGATEGSRSPGASKAPLGGLVGYWFCHYQPNLSVNYAFFPDGTYVREVNNGGTVTQTAGRAVLNGTRLATLSLLIRGPKGLDRGEQPPWDAAQNNGNPKRSTGVIFLQDLRRSGNGMTLAPLEVSNPDGSNSMPEIGSPLSCDKVEGVALGLSNAKQSIGDRL